MTHRLSLEYFTERRIKATNSNIYRPGNKPHNYVYYIFPENGILAKKIKDILSLNGLPDGAIVPKANLINSGENIKILNDFIYILFFVTLINGEKKINFIKVNNSKKIIKQTKRGTDRTKTTWDTENWKEHLFIK